MAKKTSARKKTAKQSPRKKKSSPRKKAGGEPTPDLYCIDASIYIFRAYFSMPDSIRDEAGRPVNAVYGFADFLIKFIEAARPAYLGVFFDESLNTSFRNEIYPPYKTNRELPPADLERQLKLCRELSRLMGGGDYAHDRYEADDLIGATMHRHRAKFKRRTIVSSDKDLAQLLTQPKDILWDYARERRFDAAGIEEHFGVPPERIADLLALAGDAVDNIPGLPGIGQKTAAALIQKFGGIESVLKRTDEIAAAKDLRGAARIAATLAENAELARTCLAVTRIGTKLKDAGDSVPSLRELQYRGADLAGLKKMFAREGFGGRLIGRLEKLFE
ncbi:MAG: hypothetical protein NXI24_21695 [bacterium]|nr:hypothetical protein [bacterium]